MRTSSEPGDPIPPEVGSRIMRTCRGCSSDGLPPTVRPPLRKSYIDSISPSPTSSSYVLAYHLLVSIEKTLRDKGCYTS